MGEERNVLRKFSASYKEGASCWASPPNWGRHEDAVLLQLWLTMWGGSGGGLTLGRDPQKQGRNFTGEVTA